MSSKRKLGYNWKARRQKAQSNVGAERSVPEIEGLSVADTSYHAGVPDDSNALILPSKRKKIKTADADPAPKRKKLSSKQKKRLQKIVEAKQRKAQRASVLESLSSMALPQSEMALLQPSTSIGSSKKSNRQIQREVLQQKQLRTSSGLEKHVKTLDPIQEADGDDASLSGTSWRKKRRRRRKLKVEKMMLDPKPPIGEASDGESSDEEESDQNSEGSSEDECQSVEASHNRVIAASQASPYPTLSPPVATTVATAGPSAPTSLGKSPTLDDNKSQLSREQCGGETAKKKEGTDTLPSLVAKQPAKYVEVQRDPEIQAARLSLPILAEEQVVMEAINEHSVVIICGETGSGKTTQVPQFLYEAGYTHKGPDGGVSLIGITEPRRVAAVSMSKRVAHEMGLSTQQVSYQIRYEGNTTDDTIIKFMTDGILLKEVEKDFLLSKYSVIILDEAHERSVFTDILIGLLSRIVPLREKNGNPLKLVIMSATLRVEDFTENRLLFPSPPPVISVESRQYSVTVHFNKRTPVDYLGEAYSKVCKIHHQLNTGNILVFVTGQAEVHRLCRKLRKTFPSKLKATCNSDIDGCDTTKVRSDVNVSKPAGKGKRQAVKEINLDDYPVLPNQSSTLLHDYEDEEGTEELLLSSGEESEGEEEEEMENEFMEEEQRRFDAQLPMLVLPLYSLLSVEQQARVFVVPHEGVRLCVVATNVAETSLTIPNVKYVIDTGKVKRRYYDKITGVSTFRVTWTSKASANQRAGRAGRTEPGHCYRLYSSAVFHNEFEQFSPPEITRRPVDDLVLQMKAMCINRVVNFPFPTAPSVEALDAAEKLLVRLGALKMSDKDKRMSSATSKSNSPPTITPLGRAMAQFPVAPRYAKMLALGRQHGCLPYVIVIVAALSVKEIFAESDMNVEEVEGSDEEEIIAARKRRGRIASRRRAWAGQGEGLLLGDLMVLLRAVGACEYAGCTQDFCRKNGLRLKAMLEVRKLRQQLTNAVNTLCPDAGASVDPNMPPPSDMQVRCLRQIVLAGQGDHVTRRIATDNMNKEDKQKLKYAYQSTLCEAPVFLHSSSVLLYAKAEFVIFQELIETSKLFMREVMAIERSWLPLILPENCTFSVPLELPPPSFDDATGTIKCHMTCNYGELSWALGAQELPYPDTLEKYRVFGQFLLQGKVIPNLAQFSPYLLTAPVTMMKKWSKLHKQCEVLLSALVKREVSTRSSLLEAWREEPKYLLKAYSMWLPEEKHKTLASVWPSLSALYSE